jgi:hypothetical protein
MTAAERQRRRRERLRGNKPATKYNATKPADLPRPHVAALKAERDRLRAEHEAAFDTLSAAMTRIHELEKELARALAYIRQRDLERRSLAQRLRVTPGRLQRYFDDLVARSGASK